MHPFAYRVHTHGLGNYLIISINNAFKVFFPIDTAVCLRSFVPLFVSVQLCRQSTTLLYGNSPKEILSLQILPSKKVIICFFSNNRNVVIFIPWNSGYLS